MKMHLLKLSTIVASGALFAGCASDRDMGSSSQAASGAATGSSTSLAARSDAQFVKDAVSGGLAEVKMGQLLQQKAQSEELKQFGRKLVAEHTQANQELMAIANQKGFHVPTQVRAEDQQPLSRLSAASGREFDQLAREEAVRAHQKAVDQFRSAQNTIRDAELKAFIQKTLPVLEQHLQHAQGTMSGSATEQGASENVEGSATVNDDPNMSAPSQDATQPQEQQLPETQEMSPSPESESDSSQEQSPGPAQQGQDQAQDQSSQ